MEVIGLIAGKMSLIKIGPNVGGLRVGPEPW